MSETLHRPSPHSVWLCPAKEYEAPLTAVVSEHAARVGAPTFAPHATLLGDLEGSVAQTAQMCTELTSNLGPITARVTALNTSAAFFMALFLDLSVPDDIAALRATLAKELGGAAPSAFRPHVSLGYGAEAARISADAMADLEHMFVGRSMVFDRFAVVSSAKSIPIEDWREVHEIVLR